MTRGATGLARCSRSNLQRPPSSSQLQYIQEAVRVMDGDGDGDGDGGGC